MLKHRREARLKAEFATLYVGVTPNEWRPIGEVLDSVAATRLLSGRCSGELLAGRPLDERHFEFRGGPDRSQERAVRPSRATDA